MKQSWFTKNWRPMCMVMFMGLVALDALNVLPNRLTDGAYTLMTVVMGGYAIGRSVEKVVDKDK